MDSSRESVTFNLVGKVREVIENGKRWLVAPAAILIHGVLNGSKGPLYYPDDESRNTAHLWDRMPITLQHPFDPVSGRALSSKDAGVYDRQWLGEVRNPTWNGKTRVEMWFDADVTQRKAPEVYRAVKNNQPMDLSTGLYTDNEEVSGQFNGTAYSAIARNHRPDHLAVLPNQRGACSVSDGCGVHVTNANPEDHNQYTGEGSTSDKIKQLWSRGDHGASYGDIDKAVDELKGMTRDEVHSTIAEVKGQGRADTIKAVSKGSKAKMIEEVRSGVKGMKESHDFNLRRNSNPEGHNQYTSGGETRDVSLPDNPKKLDIDTARAFLDKKGYKLGAGETSHHEGLFQTTYQVTTPEGKTIKASAKSLKELVYSVNSEHCICVGVMNQEGKCMSCGKTAATENKLTIWQKLGEMLGITSNAPAMHHPVTGQFTAAGAMPGAHATKGWHDAHPSPGAVEDDDPENEDQVDALGIPVKGTATKNEAHIAYNRDWPKDKRDKLDDDDFAGPHQSFPITTQADVDSASKLIGHADNPDEVKSRIKAIAKRKGLSIPDAWKDNTTNCGGTTMPMNDYGTDPHQASKQAAGASLMTEHEDATKTAMSAMKKSGKDDHGGAATDHVASAEYHEAAATEERKKKDGSEMDAERHDNASAMHRRAASLHQAVTNSTGDIMISNRGDISDPDVRKAMFARMADEGEESKAASSASGKAEKTGKAEDHRKAASAHREAASYHKGEGNKEMASGHSAAAKHHDYKARTANNHQGDTTVKLTDNERQAIVDTLVSNCSCQTANVFEEADRETLNKFTDAKLLRLKEQREKVVNAAKKGKEDQDEDDSDMEDDDDSETENRLNPKSLIATMNMVRKIDQLTSHITDNAAKDRMVANLSAKTSEELDDLLLIRGPVANQQHLPTGQQFLPMFAGAAGGPPTVNNRADDKVNEGAVLNFAPIDYAAIAKERQAAQRA